MSLTVRQVQQYSAAFKQQLDQFQGEIASNEKASERLEALFKQMQPQLDSLAKSVDARAEDLNFLERKLIAGQESVDLLARETHDVDSQTVQLAKISEALSAGNVSRVFTVPSALSEQFVSALERNTQHLAQTFSR